jgi:hypothetical protein
VGQYGGSIDLIRQVAETTFSDLPLITTAQGQKWEKRRRGRYGLTRDSLPISITSTGLTRKMRILERSWPVHLPADGGSLSSKPERQPSQYGKPVLPSATTITHGEGAAVAAWKASACAFGSAPLKRRSSFQQNPRSEEALDSSALRPWKKPSGHGDRNTSVRTIPRSNLTLKGSETPHLPGGGYVNDRQLVHLMKGSGWGC